MISDPMIAGALGFLVVFAVVFGLGWMIMRLTERQKRARSRLRDLATESETPREEAAEDKSWAGTLSWFGSLFAQSGDRSVENIRTKMMYAGYYQPMAPMTFVAVQLLMMLTFGLAVGFGVWWFFPGPIHRPLIWGSACCAIGYLLPSIWLSSMVKKRQAQLRRGLSDALDIVVLCMDGGMNLNAALQLVMEELDAHPALAVELAIVHRDMQMGLPAGESLKKFADRCGLLDVRDLASVILQSEKLGAGVAKTLRGFADAYRIDRQQKAEETAQKASVKILFPMLLCIFPAIFIVLIGPAAFQLTKLFQR